MAEGTRQGHHCYSLKSPEHGRKGGNFDIPETPRQPRVRSLQPSAISSGTEKAMKTLDPLPGTAELRTDVGASQQRVAHFRATPTASGAGSRETRHQS